MAAASQAAAGRRPSVPRLSWPSVLLLVTSANPATAVEGDAPRCSFTDGKLVIAVRSVAAEEGSGSELQITVADEERLVAKLSALLPGFLEQCWKTDLDGNGQFEIVIASSSPAEGPRVNVYEWRHTRFEPIRIPPVDAELVPAGVSAESYAVAHETLYARFRTGAGGSQKTPGPGFMLPYSFKTRKWEASTGVPGRQP